MNSRNRREPYSAMEVLIRQSLQERAGDRLPSAGMRGRILQRATRQQRRLAWQLPATLGRLLDGSGDVPVMAPHHRLLYMEGLFAPRLAWLSFNQLMR